MSFALPPSNRLKVLRFINFLSEPNANLKILLGKVGPRKLDKMLGHIGQSPMVERLDKNLPH